ncbi:hypothetical protein ACHAW5_007909 [Stephanodiscus triporus]|uniref:Uncharacterized protein n=1 Tax=Stephanodiscus triporus TaxID=2934178 RepID=A0ABD3PP84_9STRA
MRLIDDEALYSLRIMTNSSDIDTSLAYEWKGTDCFFLERKKIISLLERRYYYDDSTKVSLGGYEFCIICARSDGECGFHQHDTCEDCDEYYGSCTCRGFGWDFCVNCGKLVNCNCCRLGCTYRGDSHDDRSLDHLPCCYNADEYGITGHGGTIWKGSMRCRARMAKKGITAKSLAERINRMGSSPNIRI